MCRPPCCRAALREALGEVSAEGLALCADYVLFPLHMMLEAIAATRQPSPSSAAGGKGQQQPPPQGPAAAAGDAAAAGALMVLPAMSSDRAAEAALACVLSVLRRCPSPSGDGLLALLRRLAAVLELPQGAASEEIREQVRPRAAVGMLGWGYVGVNALAVPLQGWRRSLLRTVLWHRPPAGTAVPGGRCGGRSAAWGTARRAAGAGKRGRSIFAGLPPLPAAPGELAAGHSFAGRVVRGSDTAGVPVCCTSASAPNQCAT